MPDTQQTYIPLGADKIAALTQLKASADEEMAASLKVLIDKYGKQDDIFPCRHIAVHHKQRFTAQDPPPDWTTIMGITDEGKFFVWDGEGRHQSIPARTKLHEWHEPGDIAFRNLTLSLYEQPQSALYLEAMSHKNTLSARLAGELDQILTFVPAPDTDETNVSIAYHRINGRSDTVQKYRGMDYSGKSGKPITYGRGGSSAESPYEIVWHLCNDAKKRGRGADEL